MSDHLARDVRALKLYAVVSTIALVVLVTGAQMGTVKKSVINRATATMSSQKSMMRSFQQE